MEQANKSYDKTNLSNRADALSRQVFRQRDYRELDTEERERYSQHRVKIEFDRASYQNVNDFANLIRQRARICFKRSKNRAELSSQV